MLRKISFVMIIVIVVTSLFAGTAYAEDDIKVYVNGKRVVFDVEPTMIRDRVMVPVRAIFEALDADVEWNEGSQSISVETDELSAYMSIGYNYIEGPKRVYCDVPPLIMNDRTLIPVRAISEAFFYKVEWDDATQSVYISENENDDSYNYTIASKDDYIDYVIANGTKERTYYYVSEYSDTQDYTVSMFYYPNNADNAALGCYADYGSDTYNILLYIDDNKSRMNFVGEMLSRNGNSVLEYYFEGTINPSKFNMYYIPNITKYSLTLDGESTENTHPQVYNNGIEIVEELSSIFIDSALRDAATKFNMNLKKFGFDIIYDTQKSYDDGNDNLGYSEQELNYKKFQNEIAVLKEWGENKLSEIHREAERMYGNNETEKYLYLIEAIDALNYTLKTSEAEIKEKYGIK